VGSEAEVARNSSAAPGRLARRVIEILASSWSWRGRKRS
jgi:hypothetical protein